MTFIQQLAERDAHLDVQLERDDGARSSFIRRGLLDETTWPEYQAAYEAKAAKLWAAWRERNQIGGVA